MNSVSSPSRPSSRASAASRAVSGAAKGLLPALRLPRRAHADGLVELRGAAVGPMHGELGGAQAAGPEGVEEAEQQRPAVAARARPRGDAEERDVADVALPALA